MCDTIGPNIRSDHCDRVEKSENTTVEDIKPVCEEVTTIKTEVIEEFYDHRTSDGVESNDVKPFSTSDCFQSVTDERAAIPAYEQTLKKDCYERHIVWCKEENDFGLSEEDVAAKVDKKYACDKCSYVTKNRPNFRRHTLVHSERQFKCDTCESAFKRKDALQKHAKMHEKERHQYVCDLCGYATKSEPHFQRHTLLHGGKKEFNCATCGTSFRRKDGLRKHAKIHDNERQKAVCCPHCNKTYYTNVALQRHIDIKHAYKKYKCGLCDYTTGYKYHLKRHVQIKHGNGDKLYKCKYCEHTTHYKMNLENHERTHSNATLLKCTYKNCGCEQQYIPNEEKSCDCEPCQFETANRNSLRKHIVVKHSVKAERHTCTICTYSTYVEGYLRKHMRTHLNKESPNKYKCDYCDHATHCKESLKKHILIHTNEKIFKCTYINCKCAQRCDCVGDKPCDCEPCGYETVHSSGLKRHVLTKHSGEAKKHACQYCNFSTHIKRSLTRHLLRKHANMNSTSSEIGDLDNGINNDSS